MRGLRCQQHRLHGQRRCRCAAAVLPHPRAPAEEFPIVLRAFSARPPPPQALDPGMQKGFVQTTGIQP